MNIFFDYKNTLKELIQCNVCSSSDHTELLVGDRYNIGIRSVICNKCSLVFINPRPTAEAFKDFYSNHYRVIYKTVEVPDKKYIKKNNLTERAHIVYNFVKDFINNHLKTKKNTLKILDIGAGEGAFLKLVNEKHKNHIKSLGVEPTVKYAKFAKQYSNSEIFIGAINDYYSFFKKTEKYNLIVINHALEHFLDPLELIKIVYELIENDGLLFIEVPNILGNWSGLSMFHIAHTYNFHPLSINNLLRKGGFEPQNNKKWTQVLSWSIANTLIKSTPKEVIYPDKKEIDKMIYEIHKRIDSKQNKFLFKATNWILSKEMAYFR